MRKVDSVQINVINDTITQVAPSTGQLITEEFTHLVVWSANLSLQKRDYTPNQKEYTNITFNIANGLGVAARTRSSSCIIDVTQTPRDQMPFCTWPVVRW